MDGMYAGFAGAKACHEKTRINRDPLIQKVNCRIDQMSKF